MTDNGILSHDRDEILAAFKPLAEKQVFFDDVEGGCWIFKRQGLSRYKEAILKRIEQYQGL